MRAQETVLSTPDPGPEPQRFWLRLGGDSVSPIGALGAVSSVLQFSSTDSDGLCFSMLLFFSRSIVSGPTNSLPLRISRRSI